MKIVNYAESGIHSNAIHSKNLQKKIKAEDNINIIMIGRWEIIPTLKMLNCESFEFPLNVKTIGFNGMLKIETLTGEVFNLMPRSGAKFIKI